MRRVPVSETASVYLLSVVTILLIASGLVSANRFHDNPDEESTEFDKQELTSQNGSYHYGFDQFHEGLHGAQVLRVPINNDNDKLRFETIRKSMYIDMIHSSNSEVDILVRSSLIESTRKALKNLNFEFKCLIEDVQKEIDLQYALSSGKKGDFCDEGVKYTFDEYHSVTDIHSYLDSLAKAYSSFVSTEIIGKTHGKRPLKVLKIAGKKENATAIWIDGGIHAREWIASAVAVYIARELTERRDPKAVTSQFDYYILPMVNPDGYEFSRSKQRYWRKNRRPGKKCHGIDLNRNYGFKWGGKGSDPNECSEIYRGKSSKSERETKAITKYITRKSPKIQGFVTFHSYGQYILYPYGYGKKLPENHEELHRVGENAARNIKSRTGAEYRVGNSNNLLYSCAGVADDWAKGKGKIKYTYTVELRDKGKKGFLLPPSEIEGTGKDGFEVIKAIAEALHNSSTSETFNEPSPRS